MKAPEIAAQLNLPAAADEILVEVLDGYLAALETGQAIEPELLFAQHPGLAPRLRACLAGLQLLEKELPGLSRSSAPKLHLEGYEIIREAGRGGMGIVYEARESETDRRV